MTTLVRKAIPLLVIVAVVLGTAGFGFAGGWRLGSGRAGHAEEMLTARIATIEGLELSQAQVDQIQALLQEAHQDRMNLQQGLAQLRYEFQSMMWQGNPDETALRAKLQDMEELREQVRGQAPVGARIRELLTAEQQEQLGEQCSPRTRPDEGQFKRGPGMMRGMGMLRKGANGSTR